MKRIERTCRPPAFRMLLAVLMVCPLFLNSQQAYSQKPTSNSTQMKEIEASIEDILGQLTLEEKVAMCHAQSKFSTPGVPRLGIPELWMSDGPHGVRGEINWDNWGYAGWTNDSITAFPALTCLAATFNLDLSFAYGQSLGEEARYRKKDVLLGPGVNIYRTPLNGRNFEYMGEDPFLASEMVVPYIKGVQANGVAACVKHFALNNQEKWRNYVDVQVSDRALHEIYLPAFKAAVEKGNVWAVMGSYNKFRGQYCSHHEFLINTILKGDWAFDGVVITDWGSAHDTREAALYGLDIEMGTGTDGLTSTLINAYDNYYLANPFLEMLKSGEVPEEVLDDKVRRILRLMYRTSMNPDRGMGKMNNQEHLDVARKVASEGMVLLKNQGQFFPLDPDKEMTLAVIGENATRSMTQGGGSSELKAKIEVSPLDGLRQRFPKANILHAMGYASGPSVYGRVEPARYDADSLRQEALAIASKADKVLFIGGLNKSHRQDCEGGDRENLRLPFGQDNLLSDILEVNKEVGVVLISGNAVSMPWADDVQGILQAWYAGSMAGYALADILSGDVNPSGKLPFTFPETLVENAAHHFGEASYPGIKKVQQYAEGIFVGYRWHETKKIKPLFPFGFGLSYTSFKVSEIKTNAKRYGSQDTVTVSFEIENTGSRAGAEVVQVYMGKPDSKIERPTRELKGFQKLDLKPGESQSAEICTPISSFRYFNEDFSGWQLEPGVYRLYVGNASDHTYHTLEIEVGQD
ncbi:beta-glucosidase family protein [Robiginitalea sp.]|uniref:beta-glucosidase family protein n=1 Tax=Robiginitalea sp. TaxID=1902411 RepID=UPI003C561DC0